MDNRVENKSAVLNRGAYIGGQALLNGVMIRAPRKIAIALRGKDNQILISTHDVLRRRASKNTVIRDISGIIESFKVSLSSYRESSKLIGKSQTLSPSLALIAGCVTLGLFTHVLSVYIKAPALAIPGQIVHILSALLDPAFILMLLLFLRLFPNVRKLLEYHGAEHKVITWYERNIELTLENVKRQSRFQPRCGTNIFAYVLICDVVLSLLLPEDGGALFDVIYLAAMLCSVYLSFKLIQLSAKKQSLALKILTYPGMLLQRLTTIEPNDEQIACALVALNAAIGNVLEEN